MLGLKRSFLAELMVASQLQFFSLIRIRIHAPIHTYSYQKRMNSVSKSFLHVIQQSGRKIPFWEPQTWEYKDQIMFIRREFRSVDGSPRPH
jgi:hypothetical protein